MADVVVRPALPARVAEPAPMLTTASKEVYCEVFSDAYRRVVWYCMLHWSPRGQSSRIEALSLKLHNE
jgi:hypothetical protein